MFREWRIGLNRLNRNADPCDSKTRGVNLLVSTSLNVLERICLYFIGEFVGLFKFYILFCLQWNSTSKFRSVSLKLITNCLEFVQIFNYLPSVWNTMQPTVKFWYKFLGNIKHNFLFSFLEKHGSAFKLRSFNQKDFHFVLSKESKLLIHHSRSKVFPTFDQDKSRIVNFQFDFVSMFTNYFIK